MNYPEYIQYDKILARRVLAALCDYLCYFIACYVYFLFMSETRANGFNMLPLFPHVFSFILLWFLWIPFIESRNGYTFFKLIFNIKVVHENIARSSLLSSLIRHLFDPIDLFFFFGAVGLILSKVTKKHQRLGDMLAGTRVILLEPEQHHEIINNETLVK
ncbi:MAG: RDD family protein [Bacteroidetes bacterium]|nr:MAG: RDD family protein [Bacteroidota bacterium]